MAQARGLRAILKGKVHGVRLETLLDVVGQSCEAISFCIDVHWIHAAWLSSLRCALGQALSAAKDLASLPKRSFAALRMTALLSKCLSQPCDACLEPGRRFPGKARKKSGILRSVIVSCRVTGTDNGYAAVLETCRMVKPIMARITSQEG